MKFIMVLCGLLFLCGANAMELEQSDLLLGTPVSPRTCGRLRDFGIFETPKLNTLVAIKKQSEDDNEGGSYIYGRVAQAQYHVHLYDIDEGKRDQNNNPRWRTKYDFMKISTSKKKKVQHNEEISCCTNANDA